MKNYRYHVLQENREHPVSTHRNPSAAFQAAKKCALKSPGKLYGFKDTKTGCFLMVGSTPFKLYEEMANRGHIDFPV